MTDPRIEKLIVKRDKDLFDLSAMRKLTDANLIKRLGRQYTVGISNGLTIVYKDFMATSSSISNVSPTRKNKQGTNLL
jgi:hypothetical protein